MEPGRGMAPPEVDHPFLQGYEQGGQARFHGGIIAGGRGSNGRAAIRLGWAKGFSRVEPSPENAASIPILLVLPVHLLTESTVGFTQISDDSSCFC